MKRRPLKLAVFLLLFLAGGAIVNVAVAWGLAAWSIAKSPLSPSEWKLRLKPSDDDHVWWRLNAANRFQTPLLLADHECGRGLDIRLLTGANPEHVRVEYEPIHISYEGWNTLRGNDRKPERFDRAIVLQSGWPQISMRGVRWDMQIARGQRGNFEEYEIGKLASFVVPGDQCSYSLALPAASSTSGRVLPLRPIWPGFAINTILYAAILWLLWIAPGKVKRFVRVRRGRCPACGYFIDPTAYAASGGLCSECGATLPWALVNTSPPAERG